MTAVHLRRIDATRKLRALALRRANSIIYS